MILVVILGVFQLLQVTTIAIPVAIDCGVKDGRRIAVGDAYTDKSNGLCKTYFCEGNSPPELRFLPGNLQCSDEGMCYAAATEIRKSNCMTWLCSQEVNGWDKIPGCPLKETCLYHGNNVLTFEGKMCSCKRGKLECAFN